MITIHHTIQESIPLFSKTKSDVLEVFDDEEQVVGFLLLDDLYKAIQKGELTAKVSFYMRSAWEEDDLRSANVLQNDKPPFYNDFREMLDSRLFSEIIDSFHDGVYITDGIGMTVKVNRAYERITGISEDEVIGQRMRDLEKKGYISQSASIEVLKKKRAVTIMQTIRNGRQIIVSAMPIFDDEKQIIYVISSVRDITELLKLKHELDEFNYWKNEWARDKKWRPILDDIHHFVTSMETNDLYQLAERVAKTDVKVLLQGETGVGKGLIARFIHERSTRNHKAFLELNCAAIPANLLEAELFGYEPGAFTGASKQGKKGLLELAHGGTLFLDEIGDLPLELQVKLLKVVEENKFMRIGSLEVQEVDVRIISATHKDLSELVEQGKFREDLYYRLHIVPIQIPPLRNRKKEIIPLIQYYLDKYNQKYNVQKKMNLECLDWLTEYRWPGNVRELMNVIERLVVTVQEDEISIKHLPKHFLNREKREPAEFEEMLPLKDAVERLERRLITNALKKYRTTRRAAEMLGVSQSTIVQKLKKWESD